MKFLIPAIALTLTLSACSQAPSSDDAVSAVQTANAMTKDYAQAGANCSSASAGSLCTVALPEGKTIGACSTHIAAQTSVCVIGSAQ